MPLFSCCCSSSGFVLSGTRRLLPKLKPRIAILSRSRRSTQLPLKQLLLHQMLPWPPPHPRALTATLLPMQEELQIILRPAGCIRRRFGERVLFLKGRPTPSRFIRHSIATNVVKGSRPYPLKRLASLCPLMQHPSTCGSSALRPGMQSYPQKEEVPAQQPRQWVQLGARNRQTLHQQALNCWGLPMQMH